MDIFMRGVALAATEDDVKVELAKILHKAPFPPEPLLNFDTTLFKKHNSRGKVGILTLPNENAGQIFLRSYGTAGVKIKGSKVLFSPSNKPLNEEKVAILNSRQWRDPQKLKMEKEQRIREGRPYPLKSYAFGHFLNDGSFSSEFVAEGTADIACDLERHLVRFTLRKQSQPSNSDNIVTLMLNFTVELPTTIVSYPVKSIDTIVESQATEEPIIFIKANTFPLFSTETPSLLRDQADIRRSQGLIPDVPMPPGCFSLACTFADEGDKEAFVYAAQTRFHLRHAAKLSAIHVRDNISVHHATGPDHDFLSGLPFELAFEVEKAITNWTLSLTDVRSLEDELGNLCETHGDAAGPIFRRFISLLEDEGMKMQSRRRRRRGQNHAAPTTTLHGRLRHATELYLEEQLRPRGLLAPALPSPAVSYSYHMILTPTRYILEGPVTDQSNSVLRRFGHHECFLRVSFQDENRSKLRRDLESSITELLEKRYRPVLLHGCTVAGRPYEMLGYSMSGLKEHSLWFVTRFQDDQGEVLDAKTIRESLVSAVSCFVSNAPGFTDARIHREIFRACYTNLPGSGRVGLRHSLQRIPLSH